MKPTGPLAIDACPRRRQCAHAATTRIGVSGRCPDCGTQVFGRGASAGGSAPARDRALHTQINYSGGGYE